MNERKRKAQARYLATAKGREARRRAIARYNASRKGKRARERYQKSQKGKATLAACRRRAEILKS